MRRPDDQRRVGRALHPAAHVHLRDASQLRRRRHHHQLGLEHRSEIGELIDQALRPRQGGIAHGTITPGAVKRLSPLRILQHQQPQLLEHTLSGARRFQANTDGNGVSGGLGSVPGSFRHIEHRPRGHLNALKLGIFPARKSFRCLGIHIVSWPCAGIELIAPWVAQPADGCKVELLRSLQLNREHVDGIVVTADAALRRGSEYAGTRAALVDAELELQLSHQAFDFRKVWADIRQIDREPAKIRIGRVDAFHRHHVGGLVVTKKRDDTSIAPRERVEIVEHLVQKGAGQPSLFAARQKYPIRPVVAQERLYRIGAEQAFENFRFTGHFATQMILRSLPLSMASSCVL